MNVTLITLKTGAKQMILLTIIGLPLLAFLNRLKGVKVKQLGWTRVPLVYTITGLYAALLAYTVGLPPHIVLICLGYGLTYALWRQKGPTLAWIGGQSWWNPHWEKPNHKYINILLKKFHRLDIDDVDIYYNSLRIRLGNIGGAYRGFLYFIPFMLLAGFIHPIGYLTALTSLFYGYIHTITGEYGPWGTMKDMVKRAEILSGVIILYPNIVLPILMRGLIT